MVTLAEVMAYLFNRYGTEAMVISAMIGELLLLPIPKDEKQEEINLAKISSLTSICETEGDLSLFTMDKIKTLVNCTLQESTKSLFWNQFLASCYMNKMYTVATPIDQWEHIYEKDFSKHRVMFLNSFIRMRLEVLRNMQGETVKKRNEHGRNEHGSKVTDKFEKFSCPLCSTPHRDDKYSNRPYLSVCTVFIEMKVELRRSVY